MWGKKNDRSLPHIERILSKYNSLDIFSINLFAKTSFRIVIELFLLFSIIFLISLIFIYSQIEQNIQLATSIEGVRSVFSMGATVGSIFAGLLLTMDAIFSSNRGERANRRCFLFLDKIILLSSHLCFIFLALSSFIYMVGTTSLSGPDEATMTNLANIIRFMDWGIAFLIVFVIIESFSLAFSKRSALLGKKEHAYHGVMLLIIFSLFIVIIFLAIYYRTA